MTLGERIKSVRKNNKMNQTEFARSLGISQTHISKIEKNIEMPSETIILFIAFMYGVGYDWLKEEKGTYSGINGIDEHDYYERLKSIRHKLENRATYMGTDAKWEYVDSIDYFEKILNNCCKDTDVNLPSVIQYYKCIKDLMFHFLLLSDFPIRDAPEEIRIERTKKMIMDDIDRFMELRANIKK